MRFKNHSYPIKTGWALIKPSHYTGRSRLGGESAPVFVVVVPVFCCNRAYRLQAGSYKNRTPIEAALAANRYSVSPVAISKFRFLD